MRLLENRLLKRKAHLKNGRAETAFFVTASTSATFPKFRCALTSTKTRKACSILCCIYTSARTKNRPKKKSFGLTKRCAPPAAFCKFRKTMFLRKSGDGKKTDKTKPPNTKNKTKKIFLLLQSKTAYAFRSIFRPISTPACFSITAYCAKKYAPAPKTNAF